MSEITRVPLQPIAKGAVTKLWVGIAAVALAASGIALATLPPRVDVETIKPDATFQDLLRVFQRDHVAIVADKAGFIGLITRIDLLNYLRKQIT